MKVKLPSLRDPSSRHLNQQPKITRMSGYTSYATNSSLKIFSQACKNLIFNPSVDCDVDATQKNVAIKS